MVCNDRFTAFVTSLLLAVIALLWFGPPAAAQDDDAKRRAATRDLNAAVIAHRSREYGTAAKLYLEFVKKHPQDDRHDQAHFFAGVCLIQDGKFTDAAAQFATVADKFKKSKYAEKAKFYQGVALAQQAAASKKPEDYQQAAKVFGEFLQAFSKSTLVPRALYNQGEALFAAGKIEEAIDAYQQIASSHTGSAELPDALYALGTAQQELAKAAETSEQRQAKYAEAAATFKQFLDNKKFEQHPLATEVRLRYGMTLFQQGKYQDALPHFAAAAGARDFPLADFALLREAQCQEQLGEHATAAELLTKLLSTYKESTYRDTARLVAGKCFYLTQKYNDAAKMLTELADGKSSTALEAAYWLARAQLAEAKPADALKTLETAIGKNEEGEFTPYAALLRIDALYKIEDRKQEAAKLYADFAAKYSDHELAAEALHRAALSALSTLEDYAAARKHGEAFLAREEFKEKDQYPSVLFITAEAHLLGAEDEVAGAKTATADQLYRRLTSEFPQHRYTLQAHVRVALLLFREEKHQETIKYLEPKLKDLEGPQLAEANLLLGRSYADQEQPDHQKAVAAFEAGLKADAEKEFSAELLYLAAQAHRQLDDVASAKKKLQSVVSQHGGSEFAAPARLALGEIAQAAGDFDEAIKQFAQVLKDHPEDAELAPTAAYNLALAQFSKQDFEAADKTLSSLLAKPVEPERLPQARYLRGLARRKLKNYEGAAEDLKKFLAGNPPAEDRPSARYELSLCQFELKQYDDAAKTLQAILKEDTAYDALDLVNYQLGLVYTDQEDKDAEAAAAFRTVAEKYPDSELAPRSWFRVGNYHDALAKEAAQDEAQASEEKAQLAKAEAAFSSGLAKAKDDEIREKLFYKLADVYYQQEKYGQAADTAQKQLSEYPQGELAGPATLLAADSHYRAKAYDKALPLFEKALTYDDEESKKYRALAIYRAGDSAKSLGNWQAAKKHFERLLKEHPDFAQLNEARYGLGLALRNLNMPEQAIEVFQDVIQVDRVDETEARARFMIGEIEFDRKNFKEAITHFLKVPGYGSPRWSAEAHYEAARAYKELKDIDKAKVQINIILNDETYKKQPIAADAGKLLASLGK